jgi:hypothetical protein
MWRTRSRTGTTSCAGPHRRGEPGHTFVLIDETGTVSWVKNYAPENGRIMYIVPDELVKVLPPQL